MAKVTDQLTNIRAEARLLSDQALAYAKEYQSIAERSQDILEDVSRKLTQTQNSGLELVEELFERVDALQGELAAATTTAGMASYAGRILQAQAIEKLGKDKIKAAAVSTALSNRPSWDDILAYHIDLMVAMVALFEKDDQNTTFEDLIDYTLEVGGGKRRTLALALTAALREGMIVEKLSSDGEYLLWINKDSELLLESFPFLLSSKNFTADLHARLATIFR